MAHKKDALTDPLTVERLADSQDECWLTCETLRALSRENERMREVLNEWLSNGCPHCGGDCASGNPPVSLCIMRRSREAMERITEDPGPPLKSEMEKWLTTRT